MTVEDLIDFLAYIRERIFEAKDVPGQFLCSSKGKSRESVVVELLLLKEDLPLLTQALRSCAQYVKDMPTDFASYWDNFLKSEGVPE